MPISDTTAAETNPKGALSNIKVLDLTSYYAGPYGCTLLADLGADVIKIESPQGDMMRNYPSTLPGESRAFVGANRSKRSIVLDLKQPDGLAILLRMVETADVLVHSFRPSVPERIGVDYDRLRQINDRLVYCALTGYGESGPLANNPGFDQVLQCMTGLCTFQGAAGPPEIVLGSVVDFYASALMAYGVTAALLQRERDGKGQYVGASLLRSALAMQPGRFIWADNEPKENNRDIRVQPLTGIHPTKDGYLYLSAHSRHFWVALCEAVGMPEFADDPRCATMSSRIAISDILVPRLRECLAARTATQWAEVLGQRVPNAPVQPIEHMFDHPQVLDQDLVAHFDHATIGGYRGFAHPVHLSRTPGPAPFASPVFGQHTGQVLAEYGYSAADVTSLKAQGVVQ